MFLSVFLLKIIRAVFISIIFFLPCAKEMCNRINAKQWLVPNSFASFFILQQKKKKNAFSHSLSVSVPVPTFGSQIDTILEQTAITNRLHNQWITYISHVKSDRWKMKIRKMLRDTAQITWFIENTTTQMWRHKNEQTERRYKSDYASALVPRLNVNMNNFLSR